MHIDGPKDIVPPPPLLTFRTINEVRAMEGLPPLENDVEFTIDPPIGSMVRRVGEDGCDYTIVGRDGRVPLTSSYITIAGVVEALRFSKYGIGIDWTDDEAIEAAFVQYESLLDQSMKEIEDLKERIATCRWNIENEDVLFEGEE